MKAKILKLFIVTIAMFVFIMKTSVYAANNYTCNIEATPDKISVKTGEDITYNLKVSNINAGNGLKMIEFYTGNYDSSKFECKVRNYNEDKWSLINREGYVTITSNNSEAWKNDEIIAKVIYTPKIGLTDGTYQTQITNIKSTADDDSLITITDLSLNIKVESAQNSSEDTEENDVNKNYTCNMAFTPDKNSVKPGEEIVFNVNVSNINAGNGLKNIEFYIGDFDSNKFDCKISNYNEDKWLLVNKEGYIEISPKNSEVWNTNELLAKIIYTPKTGLENNTYQTRITNIKAATADNSKIALTDTTLNIIVESLQNSVEEKTSENTMGENKQEKDSTEVDTIVENTPRENVAEEIEENAKREVTLDSDTTKTARIQKKDNKNGELPYSGDIETFTIIIGIAILISLSICFYIRYKRINL